MHLLSGLDAGFLFLETPQMPMHVGALNVLALPVGHRGSFATDLRRLIAARLPLLPALRRRLWWMPLNLANPAWVDAAPDLRLHIVRHPLPASARQGDGMQALHTAVAALHAQALDRHRPLWRFHVLEGLAPLPDGRRRVGLYSQLHHAAVDGQAAVALAQVLYDLSPTPREIVLRPSTRPRRNSLGTGELLQAALLQEARLIGRFVGSLPQALGSAGQAAGRLVERLRAPGESVSNLRLAPRTPLNVSVGAGRAFATVSLPLDALRKQAHVHGATLNDALLVLCASALRRYWQAHRWPLPRKPMVAAVPISLRAAGDAAQDNQASMSFISLGTHIADDGRRLRHILAASAAMKSTMGTLKQVLPTDYPSLGMPWLLQAGSALYGRARVAEKLPPLANLVISNVPGPTGRLYLAGAELLSNHPTSIVVHGVALNITAQSLGDRFDLGLMADAAAMPDVQLLAESLEAAWQAFRALPASKAVRAVAGATAPTRARPRLKPGPAR